VVFGRDRTDVNVREAVEASSAVPALFRPKQLGDERFVDGGLPSPTHADLAADCDPDLVIVSSPMTRPSRRPLRVLARRHLAKERSTLARRGLPTIVIQPPQGSYEVFKGYPRRSRAAAPGILAVAIEATRQAVAEAPVRPL
jgi:NTE family protein